MLPPVPEKMIAGSTAAAPHAKVTGRLEWIGVRPARRADVVVVDETEVVVGRGLQGDHYVPKRGGRREVTLIQSEHLPEIAAACGLPEISPDLLRRNLVISGILLADSGNRLIQIGEVVLRPTGPCSPCARMDEALGAGGRKAMSGRGGLTTEVVTGGRIRTGDAVRFVPDLPATPIDHIDPVIPGHDP